MKVYEHPALTPIFRRIVDVPPAGWLLYWPHARLHLCAMLCYDARSMKKCTKVYELMRHLQAIALPLLLVLSCTTAPVSAQDGDPTTALGVEAAQILADVNQARLDHGLPALPLNLALTQAAQAHVDDIIASGRWGHYGSDGSNVQMRTARAGYGSSWVSENWVAVSSTEQAIVWWMNDWIHRVNILSAHWDEIGVGAGSAPNGYWIFVTDFGNSDGSAPQYASSPTDLPTNTNLPVERVPSGGMDYTVVPGDTLLGIAIRHGLDWQDIAVANNLDEDDLLQIGDTLRLPSIDGAGEPAAEKSVENVAPPGQQRYTIATGDTLSKIALRHGVTWQQIAAANDMDGSDLLRVGQEIVVPTSLDRLVSSPLDAAAEDTEGPAGENPASTDSQPGNTPSDSRFTDSPLHQDGQSAVHKAIVERVEYHVRAGDTLLGIALRLNVTVDDLVGANAIREQDLLQIGQVLVVPGTGEAASASLASEIAAASMYTVRAGDTIFGISLQLGVDWQTILAANGLNKHSILQPGQRLVIP